MCDTGMEPGPEHFAEVEYKVLDGMQSEMSVSGLLGYLRVGMLRPIAG